MSQSNDSPAPCADKEGHGKSTTSVCDSLCPEARGQKKRNLATVTIVAPPTGKRKKNSWVWKVMQQFEPPTRKCSVRCSVKVSKYGKRQPCGALFAWMEWFNGNINTRKPHEKGTPQRAFRTHVMGAGASSRESREERKDAVMITGEGWCLCPLQPVFCFHVQVRTAATPALAWRYRASFKRVAEK